MNLAAFCLLISLLLPTKSPINRLQLTIQHLCFNFSILFSYNTEECERMRSGEYCKHFPVWVPKCEPFKLNTRYRHKDNKSALTRPQNNEKLEQNPLNSTGAADTQPPPRLLDPSKFRVRPDLHKIDINGQID